MAMKTGFLGQISGTMLFRLIIYFVIIIFITLFASSYFIYNHFSSLFKDEIISLNNKILNQVSMFSDDFIFKKLNEQSLNLILGNGSAPYIEQVMDEELTGRSEIMLYAHRELDTIVFENRDFINSIIVHSRVNRLLVSSKFISQTNDKNTEFTEELALIEEFYRSGQSIAWYPTRRTKVYSKASATEGDIITVIYAYPISSTKDETKGCIMVNIDENSLNGYLIKFNSSMGQLMILDSAGSIISHSDPSKLYINTKSEPFVQRILQEKAPESFEAVFQDILCEVSFTPSKYYENFYYVSLTPVELFYQKDHAIKNKLLVFSFMIFIVTLILSNFLSYKLYVPFKRILNKYTGSVHAIGTGRGVNEYNLMENMLGNMSNKINDLQGILDQNREMIRCNILKEILSNSVETQDDLRHLKDTCGIEFIGGYFCAVVFTLGKLYVNSVSKNNIQLCKYSVIEYIKSIRKEDCMYIPVDTDSKTISVIVNDKNGNLKSVRWFIDCVEDFCHRYFKFHLTAAAGKYVEGLASLSLSYLDCKRALKYRFLFPADDIFFYEDMEKYENSKNTLPDPWIEKLDKCLNVNSYDEVKALTDKFLYTITTGTYSYNEVIKMIGKLWTSLEQYMAMMNIKSGETPDDTPGDRLALSDDVGGFVRKFLQTARSVFDTVAARKCNKNSEVVAQVKQYVHENLDKEISLYTAADAVHISPHYLSKIFKEETGANYIDYVVTSKMDKARELLKETNLSIEKITGKVGYAYAAYFRNKFKEYTGKTPNEYRLDMRKSKEVQ